MPLNIQHSDPFKMKPCTLDVCSHLWTFEEQESIFLAEHVLIRSHKNAQSFGLIVRALQDG